MSKSLNALPFLGLVACCLALTTRTLANDNRCDALFEEAATELGSEQYAKMLRTAEDRMRLCSDPQSAFVLGLAQANLVDSLTVSDPAEREQMRLAALRNLRVAAAGGLKTVWEFTVHDWIRHLQNLGPAEKPALEPEPSTEPLDAVEGLDRTNQDVEPLHVPPAPPPQPQSVFPWGPVLTGVLGVGALVTGVVLGVSASNNRDEARGAGNQLRIVADELDPQALSDAVRRTKALNDAADTKARWSTICLVGGAAATVGALVWYFALPPKGKWRWAALPGGMQAMVRF